MNMNNVLGLIMGGGRGTRLYPLVRDRSKPAAPIAGKYRLIGIPISNCIHAGIHGARMSQALVADGRRLPDRRRRHLRGRHRSAVHRGRRSNPPVVGDDGG